MREVREIPETHGFVASVSTTPLEFDVAQQLSVASEWQPARFDLQFNVYEPQGMVVVGVHIFPSSVRQITPTRKYGRITV